MNEEEKYFDYSLEPGKELIAKKYIYDEEPLISIITGYYNAKKYIKQTAYSVVNQTFPYWEWIIINDGSTEEGTNEILEEISSLDSRIKVFNETNHGRIKTRDIAIEKTKSDLIFVLDADDLIDRTYLECAYWSLKTNPEHSWVYADMANFDGKEFLWKQIFSVDVEKKENIIPVCSLIKKQDLIAAGGYDIGDENVHEDWHLWLRMLEKGYSPIRMNYYAFWYRNKKEGGILESFRKNKEKDEHANEVIRKQAMKIKNNVFALQFPTTTKSKFDSYPETFEWNKKPINIKGEKIRLLFIFPWFKVGGADKFNYDLISRLDHNKFDITIITTETSEYVWRQRFEKYAEIFDLTTFLNRQDWSGFMHYIIKSRNIDLVMQSNSYFGFYVIPWLKSEFPNVIFTDYLHSENWHWRNGEYPRDSIAIDGFLDRTYTCTKKLKESMKINMGRTVDNVEVVYIGVDEEEFNPDKVDIFENKDIENNKNKIEGKRCILFLCRISEEKRPIFMLKVFQKLLEKDENLVLLVVGDGEILNEMKQKSKELKINNNIIFFGMQTNVKPFYKLANVSVICSLVEGLTITTYESLAMGTPVVTANVGGQSELVDSSCGRVVQNVQTDKDGFFNRDYSEIEIERYTTAIREVLDDKSLKNNCRKKIQNGYTVNQMVNKLETDFLTMVSRGTTINKLSVINKDLYKQLIVMYNQLDIRNYFPQNLNETETLNDKEAIRRYKVLKIKEKLWKHPIWRVIIRFLQKIGIANKLKKSRLKNIIKKIIKI